MKQTTLERQFRLWTVLLVLVPSLLVMVIYTTQQIKMGKQKSLEMINQRVTSQEFLLNQWLVERMTTVRNLSQLEAFKTLDYPQMARILYFMQHSNSNFSSLSYIDKDDIFRLATLCRGNQHTALLGQPYSYGKLPEAEHISNVVIGRNSGLPLLNFSCPIYDYNGVYQGAILGSVKTSSLSPLLYENWIGKTGEILLVNQQGLLLTEPRHANILIREGILTGSAILKLHLSDAATQNIHLGESGTATWTDHRGVNVLGAYKSMPERDWTLIGKIDEDEVTTPIYIQLVVMSSSTLFILLLFFPLGTSLTHHIKRPLYWLIDQSNLIATEQYEAVIPYAPSDKIPQELSVLCENFIKMNHTIQNTVQLLKENEINLEHKVHERTIELSNMNSTLEEEIIEHQTTNTALAASRDALLVSEARYKSLFYYMHNGCVYHKIIYDANAQPIDLEYVHVNHTYEQYVDYPSSQLIGKKLTEIFPQITDETFDWMNTLITVGLSGQPNSFTQYLHCQQRWYSISAYCPAPGCVVTFWKDVTHYLSLKNEIARIDRLNLIGNMAAGLAHEIRNPLTVIKGYLQFFKKKLPPHLYDQFELILDELKRVEAIITVFLSIAKNKPSELAEQNLNEIINSIAPLLLTNAIKRGMNIEFKLSNALSPLLLSEKEIKQLLLNLAMNGLNAMHEHGTLTIETKQYGSATVLSVTDCGCGIPQNIQAKIFDPFFTTGQTGTGLGLSVCASIAQRHHATIEVASEEKKGTSFTVTFHEQKYSIKKNPPNFLFETW